jgi:hypothetical protein
MRRETLSSSFMSGTTTETSWRLVIGPIRSASFVARSEAGEKTVDQLGPVAAAGATHRPPTPAERRA